MINGLINTCALMRGIGNVQISNDTEGGKNQKRAIVGVQKLLIIIN